MQVTLRKHQAFWHGVWHHVIPYLTEEEECIFSKIFINCQHICCSCPWGHIHLSFLFSRLFLSSNIYCTLIWHITNQAAFYNLATPVPTGVITERGRFQDGVKGLSRVHFEPVVFSQQPIRQVWGISHGAHKKDFSLFHISVATLRVRKSFKLKLFL